MPGVVIVPYVSHGPVHVTWLMVIASIVCVAVVLRAVKWFVDR